MRGWSWVPEDLARWAGRGRKGQGSPEREGIVIEWGTILEKTGG